MKKKSLLLISPVLVAGAISSCGGGFKKISTDNAIDVAKFYDERLSDVIMKDTDARIHINKFGVKNGTGLFSYQNLTDVTTGKIVGVDLNNLSFTMGEQDVAQVLFPNMLLNDVNNMMNKTKKAEKLSSNSDDSDTTFANIGYALSATVSEEMIRYYTGALKELYGVTEWKHMKTNFYSQKNSKGNDILKADIAIDSLTGLKDEMVAVGIPEVDDVFKIIGEGSVNISITCDDFGYISHFALTAKSDANKKLSYKAGTQAASGGGSLPSVSDIMAGTIKPVGIDFEGEVDIDFSMDLEHNQAEEYGVTFQKSLYKITDGVVTKEGPSEVITDVSKDSSLDINPYAPIKVDPVRTPKKGDKTVNGQIAIYAATDAIYEDNGYAVKLKLKTDGEDASKWVLGQDYMYMGYDTEATELEAKCMSMLKWYNVDKVGIFPEGWTGDWVDDCQPYPYATLVVNGVRCPTKTKDESSLLGNDYCYFTVEMPDPEVISTEKHYKATDLVIVLHVGKDVIAKAKKTVGGTPKFSVDLKLQKLK